MARILLFVLATALVPGIGSRESHAATPRVGDVHGDFTLPRIDTGKPVSISDYRGKKLLLIHFASW